MQNDEGKIVDSFTILVLLQFAITYCSTSYHSENILIGYFNYAALLIGIMFQIHIPTVVIFILFLDTQIIISKVSLFIALPFLYMSLKKLEPLPPYVPFSADQHNSVHPITGLLSCSSQAYKCAYGNLCQTIRFT